MGIYVAMLGTISAMMMFLLHICHPQNFTFYNWLEATCILPNVHVIPNESLATWYTCTRTLLCQ